MQKLMILMGGLLIGSGANHSAPAWSQGTQTNLVVTSQVYETVFADRQSFVGSAQAVRQSIIGSAVEGRVATVAIEQGDWVRGTVKASASDTADSKERESQAPTADQPGQLLVQIETGTLQIEIEAAIIQRDLAKQALEELEITLPIEMELAQARVDETQARLAYSRVEFERLNRLSTQANAVSATELEQARSQFLADQQLHTQAVGELKRLTGTRELKLSQAQFRLAATQQEIVRLEDQKSKYTIRAPFDGYVVNKSTEVGAWITRGAAVAEIVALREFDFAFTAPQDYATRILEALANTDNPPPVEIQIDGLPEPLIGKLLAVVPQVDLRSRQLIVRARASNPLVGNQPLVKPGMLGKASVAIGNPRKMLVVSRDALVLGGAQPVIYKVLERGEQRSVVPIPVTVGTNQGSWVEVTGELQAGDWIVVEGNERLRANAEIKISRTRTESPTGNP